MKQNMNRRDFIKLAGVATGGLLAGVGLLNFATASSGLDARGFFDSAILSNGINMPILGFGTFPRMLNGDDTSNTAKILEALNVGYRHIGVFDNARSVGNAMVKSGISRKDNFVSIFIPLPDEDTDITAVFNQRLAELKTDYADMVVLDLTHQKGIDAQSLLYIWSDFENLYNEGRTKSLGIANLDLSIFSDFVYKCNVKPMAYYADMSPYNYSNRLVELCSHHKIVLAVNEKVSNYPQILGEKVVARVASKYDKSPAQIITKWNLQSGLAVLRELGDTRDIEIEGKLFDFRLSQNDMSLIRKLKNS